MPDRVTRNTKYRTIISVDPYGKFIAVYHYGQPTRHYPYTLRKFKVIKRRVTELSHAYRAFPDFTYGWCYGIDPF